MKKSVIFTGAKLVLEVCKFISKASICEKERLVDSQPMTLINILILLTVDYGPLYLFLSINCVSCTVLVEIFIEVNDTAFGSNSM